MSVPVFNQHPAFNSNQRSQAGGYDPYAVATGTPAYEAQQFNEGPVRSTAGVMTMDSVIMRTVAAFGLTLAGAFFGWFFPALAIPAALIGLVLGLVCAFKREPIPALILAYAGIQGVAVGGISGILEASLPGIALQALIATASVFFVVLAAYAMKLVRATRRLTKVFMFAMFAYLGYSLINFGLVMFGVVDTPFGLGTQVEIFGIPLGLLTGGLAVLLGCYSLVTDFDFVEQGVKTGAPERYSWTAAFGLVATVVWLYVEILRIIAIARNN